MSLYLKDISSELGLSRHKLLFVEDFFSICVFNSCRVTFYPTGPAASINLNSSFFELYLYLINIVSKYPSSDVLEK